MGACSYSREPDPRVQVDLRVSEETLDAWDRGTEREYRSARNMALYNRGQVSISDPLAVVSVDGLPVAEVRCGVVEIPLPGTPHVGIVYEVYDVTAGSPGVSVFDCGNDAEQDPAFPGWLNAVTFAEQYAASEVLGEPYGPTPDGRESYT